jgi:ribosome biogenesis GTPase
MKKNKLFHTDFAVVGDIVNFDLNDDGTGVIYQVLPRKNYLSRKAIKTRGASYRGERLEQIIAANIDKVFIVTSFLEPDFNNKTLDRLLVTSESAGIIPEIIINKSDLTDKEKQNFWKILYEEIGYKVFLTSVFLESGIKELKTHLKGNKNLFWGQSGVGKSSILNMLFPELKLKTGEISSYTSKGTHTTVTSTMFNVGNSTYIIDTPGIREIDPYGIKKENLGHYFPEFNKHLINCRFNTCTHHHEPDCAVINAFENEEISTERYESYLRILDTIEKDINF